MGENRLIIPAAILLACFVLWGIFYTSRINIQKSIEKQEQSQENQEIGEPIKTNKDFTDWEEPNEEYEMNFDYQNKIDEMMQGQELPQPILDITSQYYPEVEEKETSDMLQERVNNCLVMEEVRHQNIIDNYLNPISLNYVGDDNFLELWKIYEKEHGQKESKCYQLYFTE